MAIGGTGYALYSAAFLCYNHTQNEGFVIFSGAYLGFCAAFLWCAQGVVMMSYPTEGQRGRAIAITWFVFNLGAVIGAAVTAGQNWNVKSGHVTDGTYVAFIVLEAAGAVLCCFLARSESIVRVDGTRVQKVVHPSLKSDIIGLWTTLRNDLWVLLLFPMFFASNYFYTYQFNGMSNDKIRIVHKTLILSHVDMNAYWFSTRTRAFNNIFYWVAQMIGAGLFGAFLDYSKISRRNRALIGWGVMFVLVNAIWGGGLKFLLQTHRSKPSPLMDVFDSGYFWYLFLYMWYGFLDALWQSYSYYTMGAMTNSPKKLAYYAGFYKSIQAVGATIISRLDALKYPYANLFASSWALMAGSLLVALPVYLWRIKDTELTDSDFDDASLEGVEAPETIEGEHGHEKSHHHTHSTVSGSGQPATLPATGPMGVMGAASDAAELGDQPISAK